jgi:small subunit ribosomal protein S7
MLAKFMNVVMQSGKKSAAERIIYGALDRIAEKTNRPAPRPSACSRPHLITSSPRSRSNRAASAAQLIKYRLKFALLAAKHWLCVGFSMRRASAARSPWRIASHTSLMDAAENRGAAVRKREDTHRMAEANKAFAHYRW